MYKIKLLVFCFTVTFDYYTLITFDYYPENIFQLISNNSDIHLQ